MMLSLDTAYRSFGGEVEASSTPTICRLSDSRRHQLWAIAQADARHRLMAQLGEPHSITSSAPESRTAGIDMLRALAVLRFMRRLNFVGCSTGKSAGLAPLRI